MERWPDPRVSTEKFWKPRPLLRENSGVDVEEAKSDGAGADGAIVDGGGKD